MEYNIKFLKAVDDYEHDGDYDGEIECWKDIELNTKFISRDEDDVPTYEVNGTLTDNKIIRLLNTSHYNAIHCLKHAIIMYDRKNNTNIFNKFKNKFNLLEDFFENEYSWNVNSKRPIIEFTEIEKPIDEIIKPGKRGITNNQMIPILKKLINENNFGDINVLKKELPNQFSSSLKYLPKKYKNVIEKKII